MREQHGSLSARVPGKLDADEWRAVAELSGVDQVRLDRDIEMSKDNPEKLAELAQVHGMNQSTRDFQF